MSDIYEISIGIELNCDGNHIPPAVAEQNIRDLKTEAARRFGGYTMHRTEGGWINEADGKLHEERSVVFRIITGPGCDDRTKGESRVKIETFARYAAAVFDQNCVLVTRVEGGHTFISRN